MSEQDRRPASQEDAFIDERIETGFSWRAQILPELYCSVQWSSWFGLPAASFNLTTQPQQGAFIEQPADERDAMGTATLLEADGHRQ